MPNRDSSSESKTEDSSKKKDRSLFLLLIPVFFLLAGFAAVGFGFFYNQESVKVLTFILFLIGAIFVAIGIVSIVVIFFVPIK